MDSHSGLAGIAHWMNSFYKLNGTGEEVDKHHPTVELMRQKIDEEYAGGRTTVMGDEELESLLREADIELYERLSHKAVFSRLEKKSRTGK